MEAKDVQVPRNVELAVSVEDYCRIMDFSEPEDIETIYGSYVVRYEVMKDVELQRFFKTKTYAKDFVELVTGCRGAKVNGDPATVEDEIDKALSKRRIVLPDGWPSVKPSNVEGE